MKNGMVKLSNGAYYWYLNDKLHREDGPAIKYPDGYRCWYLNDKLHREDGPAIEHPDGICSWYKNGRQVDSYYPNFGCFKPTSRAEALTRLNAKERPFSRELYLADIERAFPVEE